MNKREQYKRLLTRFASALLVAVLTGIFCHIWYSCYATHTEILGEIFYRRGNYVVIILYALSLSLFYNVFGALKIGRMRIFEATLTQVLSILAVNFVTYLQLCLIGRWRFLEYIEPILWMTLADLVVAGIWVRATQWIYVRLYPPRKLLAVYGKYSPDGLLRKMAARKDRYAIEETISIDRDMEQIKEKICQYRNVILADIPDEIRNKLVKFCFEQNIRCYTVPKISDIMIKSAAEVHEFDTALLLFRNNGLNIEQRFLKRAFDILVSLIAIVVLSPLMLLIALMVKHYDGGPVIFRQERLTEDGKIFMLYKFRSMRMDSEKGEYCLTRKEDDRVTPVGRILRNIHFDELPQIFNILKGEMSFVGPRPECPGLAEQYEQMIPEFGYRLKVKAGLTGYAQVYGKYNTTPYDNLKLDLTYIKNYSFWLDVKLMLLTVKILFQRENTEGGEAWQTRAATRENLEKLRQK